MFSWAKPRKHMTRSYPFLRFVWGLLRRRPWHYAGGIVCVIVLDGVDMLPALIVKEVTNRVQANPSSVDVTTWALALGACYLVISILRMGWRFCLMIPSRAIEAELRKDAYEKLLHADFARASGLKTGDVVSTLSQDLSNIRMFMGPGILVLFDSGAYLIFIPCTLFAVLGPGALWVLLPFVALLTAVIIVQKPLERAFGVVSDTLGDVSQYVHEESQGARFFRSEGLLELRRKRYDLLLGGLFRKQLEISRWELGLDGTLQLVIQTSYLVVLILAFDGQGAMAENLGALTVSLQLLDKLLWPLMSISYLMNLFQQARTGARRYQDIEALPHKARGSAELTAPLQELRLKNFGVRSPTGEAILKGVNFHAHAGEHIAVVGAVGSGKTVLLQSLAGLWEHRYLTYEEFTVGGISYQNLDRRSLWRQLSFIPQTPQIFGRSLAANVSPLGLLHGPSLVAALEKADLTADLRTFPEGLQTLIGEKGINLSGGQKQRTLIARSFHSNARLFLWDDAISALDPNTERKVIKNLRQLDPGAILILATHRLSSLKHFDRIIVLEHGEVVRSGTFEDIKSDHALFAGLLRDEKEALAREIL